MSLHDTITDILAAAVENRECAGVNVLVRRHGEEVLYTQAGMADAEAGRLIQRDSIFRLYSQSKPITAAAVMLLAERGLIDLMDGVDKYLPGFRNPQVVDAQGNLTKAYRAPWLMELLGREWTFLLQIFRLFPQPRKEGGERTLLMQCHSHSAPAGAVKFGQYQAGKIG